MTKKLIPFISDAKPIEYIWYADKPLNLGGLPQIITTKVMEEKLGEKYKYTEMPLVSSDFDFKSDELTYTETLKTQAISWLKQPKIDHLVICDMGEVGYGVFAKKDIEPSTLVACYAGELKRRAVNTDTAEIHEYSFDLDTFSGNSCYAMDASNQGGIARFFQHLPESVENEAQTFIDILGAQPINYELAHHFLLIEGISSKQERDAIIAGFQQKLALQGEKSVYEGYRQFLQTNKNEQLMLKGYDLESLITYPPLCKANIASQNLSAATVLINGLPVLILWSSRKINKGEQLGFSYGLGYWVGRKEVPELFDLSGNIIPRSLYRRNQIPVQHSIPMQTKPKMFFYKIEHYKKDAQKQFPVQVSLGLHPKSFFYLRDELVRYNALSQEYSAIQPNSFMLQLNKILPDNIIIQGYKRSLDSASNDYFIVDVVCTAPNIKDWAKLTQLFRSSDIAEYCKCFQHTKEILIRDVNIHTEKMYRFIKAQDPSHLSLFFKREIDPALLPEEPMDNDLMMRGEDGKFGFNRMK